MDRDFLIQLTNELYSITLLFPKKEPLRVKIRDLGTDILANFLRITNFYEYTNIENPSKKRKNCSSQILEDLEILESHFEVAKAQNWVSPKTILEIKKQYYKIRDEFLLEKKNDNRGPTPVISLRARQKQVLEILEKQGKAKISDFKSHFSQLSKRTLRRDLQDLIKEGLVGKTGEKKNTFYQLK